MNTHDRFSGKENSKVATFTLDSENNIAAHPAVPTNIENAQSFATEKELAKLVDVWNSFAGVAPFTELKPVKKFTSRSAAIARIWAAVQRLSPDGAEHARDVAPAKPKSKKSPTESPRRGRAKQGAEGRSNKKAEVLTMIKRAKGATLAEIMEATGWQAHTVRGFVSILSSKGGEKVKSSKNANGQRTYRIAK
jgi:hypothetical protein